MTNLEKYNHAFMEVLSVGEDELEGLTYGKSSTWDSVGQMTLVTELEDAFDIYFETDDLLEFVSYEAGKEILKKYGVEI